MHHDALSLNIYFFLNKNFNKISINFVLDLFADDKLSIRKFPFSYNISRLNHKDFYITFNGILME